MTLGPFDITPERIQALGQSFTPFVNRLLDIEVHASEARGHQLAINYNESTPDGGVDAALRSGSSSDFVPVGDSAWQFKRTSIGPQACADEFEGASWAHEFVRSGGAYILVLAAPLPDTLIERRRLEIVRSARNLGLLEADDPDRIRVYDANRLARWASAYPSLAVSRLSGGPGSDAIDFDTWNLGRTHDKVWVSDENRRAAVSAIREQMSTPHVADVRVQGTSGIGKTRLVMEALRDPRLSPLVAYVADERSVGGELLTHLVSEGRTAILVVDECPAARHVKLVERLPNDPALKLITIGDSGAAATRAPVLRVEAVGSETTEEFLSENYRQLSAEERRFVADHSRGNMRWTIVLADRVTDRSSTQAADLIARNDIEQFIVDILPEGRDFFCATVLALLERVGWEGERRYQLDLLCRFAGLTADDMENAGRELERRELLMRQGRYRTVTPHPLAIYLAAEAWRSFGNRLVDELLPQLDDAMALSFFRRVADLGQFEPARSVLPQLLSGDGPFSSLEALEVSGMGKILTQLAIVLPDEVALHLAELVEQTDAQVLREMTSSRRDLVWTLEKLVWHTRTFTLAANTLLALALSENETYANNATGTWLDLFSVMLPGTAASPTMRIDYLCGLAESASPEVCLLCIQAAAKCLVPHESITVSGELQGGVLVEPRGRPATWEEVGEYRRSMIELLSQLTQHNIEAVAVAAGNALIQAVHPIIDDVFAGEALAEALTALRGDALRRLRTEAERLIGLYDRRERPDRLVRQRLTELLDRLPPPSPEEQLAALSNLRRWDFSDGELQGRIEEVLRLLPGMEGRLRAVSAGLQSEVPASWELGYAIADIDGFSPEAVRVLVDQFDTNPSALVGYLSGVQAAGNEVVFDEFLDSDLGQTLSLQNQVSVAVRGPLSNRTRERVIGAVKHLPVAESTYLLFGWDRDMPNEVLSELLDDWVDRVESQRDYNALVDWLSLTLHSESTVPEGIRDVTRRMLLLRRQYPDVGQERWDWSRLATAFEPGESLELGRLVIDLIDSNELMISSGDDEAVLLARSAESNGSAVWEEVAGRIAAGSWLLEMELRGWFISHVPSGVITSWIGTDLERARLVASLVAIGGDTPSEVVRYILTHFAGDEQVSGRLYASLVSGFWSGNESDRIRGQIQQLTAWRVRPEEPPGVRAWARETIEHLERNRLAALQREAEGY